MTLAPLVTVLIPAYNHEKFVQATIKSIIGQTYSNLELIIINDGSTDQTNQKIREMEEGCLRRFVRYQYIEKPNQGVAHTLNMGIQLAQGELIFFISSDDSAEPCAISTLVNVLEADGDCIFACGNADFIDPLDHPLFLDFSGIAHSENKKQFFASFLDFHTRGRKDFCYKGREFGIYSTFLQGNYIPIGLLVSRQALLDVGLYDEKGSLEDLDMWLKLSKRYKMKYVDECLCHYRLHDSNTFKKRKAKMLRSTMQLLLREREFCFLNGYEEIWKKGFVHLLFAHLRNFCFRDFFLNLKWLRASDLAKQAYWYILDAASFSPQLLQRFFRR